MFCLRKKTKYDKDMEDYSLLDVINAGEYSMSADQWQETDLTRLTPTDPSS